jgi:hypothetical protein
MLAAQEHVAHAVRVRGLPQAAGHHRVSITVRVCGGPQGARLHVLAREVPFALERSKVIVDAVGRANAHPRADLAQRRRVAAIGNRLPNEVEHHLLSLR